MKTLSLAQLRGLKATGATDDQLQGLQAPPEVRSEVDPPAAGETNTAMYGLEDVPSLIPEVNRGKPAEDAEDALGFGKAPDDAGQERIGTRLVPDREIVVDADGIARDAKTGLPGFDWTNVQGVDPDFEKVVPEEKVYPRRKGWFEDKYGSVRNSSTGVPMMDLRESLGITDNVGDGAPEWFRRDFPDLCKPEE